MSLVPSDSWQTRPDKVEVRVAGGQTAPVTFSLSARSATGTSELALKIRFETASTTTEQRVRVPLIETPYVTCTRATAPPRLDGKLDDACWQGAPPIAGLRLRIRDPAGTQPTQKTRAWLSHDTDNLYVAVSCDEAKMQDVKRTVTNDNGPIWQDDCVELWLVPNHRREAAAQLIANLLNKHYSSGVLPTWATATAMRDRGWSMEFRIPFSCLNQATPQPGDIWGFNLGRAEKPHKETSTWSPPGFHDRASDGSVVFEY